MATVGDAAVAAPTLDQGSKITWKSPAIGPTGRIDLTALGLNHPRPDSAAYVYAEVVAPEVMATDLLFGTDDGIKIWLNGQLVQRGSYGGRPAAADQEIVRVRLRAGTNHFLFKVVNDRGPSVLYARLVDPSRQLKNPEPNGARAASR